MNSFRIITLVQRGEISAEICLIINQYLKTNIYFSCLEVRTKEELLNILDKKQTDVLVIDDRVDSYESIVELVAHKYQDKETTILVAVKNRPKHIDRQIGKNSIFYIPYKIERQCLGSILLGNLLSDR